jgi:lambda family phage portal protein
MIKENWLDKTISFISPRAALARQQARMVSDVIKEYNSAKGKYEGASRTRRTDGWSTQSSSANYEIATGLNMLRQRSRDLVRNNAYASRAISVISTHTVGTGIIPQTKATSKRKKANIEAIVKDHLYTEAIDAEGRNNLFGIERLCQRAISEGGEVLLRRRRRKTSDGFPLPYQVQVLEGEYIDSSKTGVIDGWLVKNGIAFNGIGQRVGYWLFPEHPGETIYYSLSNIESRFVPASEIYHAYRIDRPGQIRGVPWTAPIIIRLRDFDEYEDAQLLRQKIAACFAAFVYDNEMPSPLGTPTQSADQTGLIEKMEPGMIELLPGGKRIEFADPPTVEGQGEYSSIQLHAVGAGIGVPYDLLTTDQSKVNFASGRLGRDAFYIDVTDWRNHMLVPHVCNGNWKWFMQGASMIGTDTKDVGVMWSPPRKPMTNPEKDIPALRDQVRSGQISFSEMCRQLGYDPDEQFAELKSDNEKLDELELILDCDPRRTDRSGSIQVAESESDELGLTDE